MTLKTSRVLKSLLRPKKSSNLNKMNSNKYKQVLHREVIKCYKKAPPNLEADLNKEAELSASKLKIENQREKLNIKNCFITLKYHKLVSVVIRYVDYLTPLKHKSYFTRYL